MSGTIPTPTTAVSGEMQERPAGEADINNEDIEQELAQLYADAAPGLLRYAVTLIRDKETSQDALQEIFLRYFVARQRGQRFTNPKAWLFRILRNHLLDILKSAAFNHEIQYVPTVSDLRCELDAQYRHTELSLEMEKLLAPRELECVRLRAEGLRYEEIADVLAIRSGTVGAMLARVHQKMQKAMSGQASTQACETAITASTAG